MVTAPVRVAIRTPGRSGQALPAWSRNFKGVEAGQRDSVGGLFVLRAGAQAATAVVVQFVDDHRDRFGVEPICRVLTRHGCAITASTYYAAKTRPASLRAAGGGTNP
jgi:hypothetical protein